MLHDKIYITEIQYGLMWSTKISNYAVSLDTFLTINSACISSVGASAYAVVDEKIYNCLTFHMRTSIILVGLNMGCRKDWYWRDRILWKTHFATWNFKFSHWLRLKRWQTKKEKENKKTPTENSSMFIWRRQLTRTLLVIGLLQCTLAKLSIKCAYD